MLTLSEISKSFGERAIFENVNLQVNRGDRLGLVGPNGAGKSTLFSMILGQAEPDAGTISTERTATFGHLPQETAPVGEETVLELATAITPEVAELQRRIRLFEAGHDTESHDFHEVQARFDAMGGYRLEPRAKSILRGLAFRDRDFERRLSEMSGGWIMRAHLARLLVQQPDLLMLDEPTNHLDLETLGWFQAYLQSYPGAVLLISHDREFLNQIVGGILEIRQRRLWRYRGTYDEYLVQREAQASQLLAAYKNQQKEIESLQRFADRFRAKASKASQAQSKLKQIERMEKIEAPEADAPQIKFRFPQPARSGRRVITLTDIHHAYGENVVYRGMNFEAERGQRIVLVGPNGAGKSTLLKLLAGVLPVQAGARELGLNVNVGYYAQHRVEMLNPSHTVLEAARDMPNPSPEQFVRTVLGSFLFSGDDVFKPVSVLSGGEKSRLALVKLLLDPPNVLLMDEPTTHLDLASIDALVQALEHYHGTLIFISHDVYFIRKIARLVLRVDAGNLTMFHGDYGYYLDKIAATSAREALTSTAAAEASPAERPVSAVRERKRMEAEARQQRSRRQKMVAGLEAEIAKLEERQKELVTVLEDPETYKDAGKAVAANREVMEIAESLARLNAEWERAAGG